jgi:hypothetical protein
MSEEGKGAIICKLFDIKKQFFPNSQTNYLDMMIKCTIELFDSIDNSKDDTFWYNSLIKDWTDELYSEFIYNFLIVIYATEEIAEENKITKKVVKCTSRDAIPEGMKVFHELHKDPDLKKFIDRFISTDYLNKPKNVLDPFFQKILEENKYDQDVKIMDLKNRDSKSKYFLIIRDLFFSCLLLRKHLNQRIREAFMKDFVVYPILIKGMVKIYDKEEAALKSKKVK